MFQAVTRIGSGPKRVLVLHGWALDSAVWRWAVPSLDHDRFTYALVDFPGYGRRIDSSPATGIDGMAEDGLRAADALGWETFSVLGHSMGGTTGLRLAGLAPDRVERVCAVTPIGAGGYPIGDADYGRFEAAWPDVGWIIRFVSPGLSEARVGELAGLAAGRLSKPAWDRYLANWSGADFLAALNGDVPTTLLVGEHDPIATLDHLAETIEALAAPEVLALPGAGHYPMVEAPREAAAAWEAALGAQRGATATGRR